MDKIIEEFVPHQEALALSQIGFNEVCLCIYNREKSLRLNSLQNPSDRQKSVKVFSNAGKHPAPLYQQAFRWLYQKTGKWIIPIPNDDKQGEWFGAGVSYKTFEEAQLACLRELIELAKK